jgi:VWFA-related protein
VQRLGHNLRNEKHGWKQSFITGVCSLALAMPLLAPSPSHSQQPQTQMAEPLTRVDVLAVNLMVTVRDHRGSLVTHLKADDFKVWDGGKPQQIDYFARQSDLPMTIAISVDVSKSRERIIQAESRTAGRFLSQVLREEDTAFLVSFGSQVTLVKNFTSSAGELSQALDGLRGDEPGPRVSLDDSARGTLLYDALYWAAHDKLSDRPGRKVVIVITDGVDQGSRITRTQVVEAAQRADTVIYGIYSADSSYPYLRGGDVMLRLLTDPTGGRLFRVRNNDTQTLGSIFGHIEQEMRSQYLLSYTLSESVPNGTFRSVEVRTLNKKLHVFAKKGYYTGRATNGNSDN